VFYVCLCRRTESGLSVDSLIPSHLLLAAAAENLNYESSDAEFEKSAIEAEDDRSASVLKVTVCLCVTLLRCVDGLVTTYVLMLGIRFQRHLKCHAFYTRKRNHVSNTLTT